METVIDKIIEDVYAGNKDSISIDYIRKVGFLITKAIYDSFNFNGDFNDPIFNEQDKLLIKALRENAYLWIGAKSTSLFKTFDELLLDKDNNLRLFNDFKKEATKAGLLFNKNYLKTEYQTIIGRAQSASAWQSYNDDDLLQYSAVGDARTRPLHRKLDGIILPKSDSFWNRFTPPIEYNCRCRTLVVVDGVKSKLSSKDRAAFRKELKPVFDSNAGKSGKLMPDNHPYWKAVSKDELERIKQIANNLMENN